MVMAEPRLDTRALAYAEVAHAGQLDKSGAPYIDHPIRVAKSGRLKGNRVAKAVAYLHDVVEDTDRTLEDIAKNFPPLVVAGVDLLTRRKDEGETYRQYIERIRDSRNPIAIQVKLADIDDNSQEWRVRNASPEVQAEVRSLQERYRWAKRVLGSGDQVVGL